MESIVGDVQIDRLVVQVPDLSPRDGRRLARKIAESLRSFTGGIDVSSLRLDLKASPETDVDELARQVVAELLRQVRRMP